MPSTIQLYSLGTPNGQKVSIALEEMEIPYTPHLINIGKGDQFSADFIKINPNSKIPAIIDPKGPGGTSFSVFESGAILVYLAEKTGKFLPTDLRLRSEVMQWLFFQMAGIGPMFGQFGHFNKWAKDKCDHPYPLQRYTTEAKRLLTVLETRLEGRQFLVGEEYSIADMATAPWIECVRVYYNGEEALGLKSYQNVNRWAKSIFARPKTAKGMTVLSI